MDPRLPFAADDHPQLEPWRANVGGEVHLDIAPAAGAPADAVDVLSWNLAVGAARLVELVQRLRAGEFGGAGREGRPLVVLAQEAFRGGEAVPEQARTRHHGGDLRPSAPDDIARIAEALGFSLRYAPSMRNGAHRSDRGNAILASVPIIRAHSFTMPAVRQRRVAVACELAAVPGLTFVSAHLDTWGRAAGAPHGGWRFGSGRAGQAAALAARLVAVDERGGILLGADLNSPLGMRDPAVRALLRAGFRPGERVGGWRRTFRGGLPLLLDHVLIRPGSGRAARTEVTRLTEAGAPRGRVWGSDHYPLLARVHLSGSTSPES